MDLRGLHAFVSVVRHGGFSAAARAVGLTQPALSKAIRLIEEEIGGAVLVRSSSGARTTELGETVLRRANAMLAERDALKAEIDALKGLVTGRLRLGLPPLGSSALFAPLIARFRALHPGVEIELREHGSRALQRLVLEGELDLAVSLQPIPAELAWLEVRDDPLVVLLPAGHALLGRDRVRLAELGDSPFVLFDSGFALNDIILEACARRGLVLKEAARSGQADMIVALVAAGLGVALLPAIVVSNRGGMASVGASLLDESDLRWTAGFVWRSSAELSPAARAWLALVREDLGAATPA